ncbi:MAG: hypothetical protein DRQ46_00035 [Gammaproteobacteria bacterium]|nr:MAG: hypothetical protein DRQ46_00035 [Gammaproteobacteria bacterium]
MPRPRPASEKTIFWLKKNVHGSWVKFIEFLECQINSPLAGTRITTQCQMDLPTVLRLKKQTIVPRSSKNDK